MSPRHALLVLCLALAPNAIGCGDGDDDTKKPPVNNNNNNNNTNNTTEPLADLTVADQLLSATRSVSVNRVVADDAGFLAIFSTNAQGQADQLLGHVPVAAGEASDVVIALSRDVSHEEVLRATLHVDEPADGTFQFSSSNATDPTVTGADGSTVSATFKVSFNPAVEVEDQAPDPLNEVRVKQVTSRGPGFIAIHAQRPNGQIGDVIGHAPVVNGDSNADISVTLERPVTDGEVLYAALHADAPADGEFTFDGMGEDDPIVLIDGSQAALAPTFTVSVVTISPSVTVEDQIVDPINEVQIKAATSIGPGWIVIQANDGQGLPGAVLGQARLSDGDNADVTVTLSRDVISGESLFASLHKDEGTVGTYEYPGADVPVPDAQGAPIRPTFIVLVETNAAKIEVEDQEASPINRVTLSRVTALEPGFIVIYESAEPGINQFGNPIGSSLVSSGVNSQVQVLLNRDARHDETLTAVLHVDRGDAGLFEYPGPDDFALNMMSMPVSKTFRTYVTNTAAASVSVQDQDPSPLNRVVVQQVVYNAPGWIVIHEDNGGGSPGAVIGKAQLTAGVSRDVAVTLDRDAVDGETLHAMLHKDEGTVGTYEFPGADAPVTDAQGAIISPTFLIQITPNSAFAIDQSPADVSTIIQISSVYARQPGFAAVYTALAGPPDMNGFPTRIPGALMGYVAVPAGLSNNLEVTLDRPVVNGQPYMVRLHLDSPADGQFTHAANGAQDVPALTPSGDPVHSPEFFTLVSPSVPAVRFTVEAVGSSAYKWVSAHPARFSSAISSTSANNPTVTLRRGWRYVVTNSAGGAHPFELITRGATRAQDTVLLSQAADPALEAEALIFWEEAGDDIGFTISPELNALDGYRCSISGHASMRGPIVLVDP